MGAWLAFLKSKILLPVNNDDDTNNAQEMSELLALQLKRLEGIQKVSKLLFKKHQLGTHFFKRGDPEFFNINNTVNYELSLYDLIKTYIKIVTKDNNKSITIAETKLYSVEDAINRLKK